MRIGKYLKEGIIGSGTYGTVYKAKEYGTNNFFAIKQINHDEVEDGIPASTIREIGILLEFRQNLHPNIVHLQEIIHRNGDISMVFEFVEYDMKRFQEEYTKTVNLSLNSTDKSAVGLPINFVKSVARQLMEAVLFCHQHRVLHRDIKPSNLLLSGAGVVKLADFGLSRTLSFPDRSYCHEVVTLWYRAPEVMLGAADYNIGIDIWSVGCLLVELLSGVVLFPGDSEIDQLFLIFRLFGTPDEQMWPGCTSMSDYKATFPKFPRRQPLAGLDLQRDAATLISTMLNYVPELRSNMANLIEYKFVRNPPMPMKLSRLLGAT